MWKLNPFSGNFDYADQSGTISNPTNPLYITPTTYLWYHDGALDIYVDNVLQITFPAVPTPGNRTGQPMGLLLGLTYP